MVSQLLVEITAKAGPRRLLGYKHGAKTKRKDVRPAVQTSQQDGD